MQRRDPAQWRHPSISTPQDLVDRKYNAEATIREQKAKLSGLEDEHGRARQELQRLRVDNARLDSGHHEHEKCINQMRTRVAVLEQEVKDKEELLEKTAAMCQSEKEQKVVWRGGCSSIHGCLIHNHSFIQCCVLLMLGVAHVPRKSLLSAALFIWSYRFEPVQSLRLSWSPSSSFAFQSSFYCSQQTIIIDSLMCFSSCGPHKTTFCVSGCLT